MKIYGLWEKLTELIFYKKGEVRINPVDQDVAGVDADKVLTIPNIDPTPQELVLSEQAQTVSNKTFTDSSYAGSHSGTYTGTFDRHEVSSAEIAAASGSNELAITGKKGVVLLTGLSSGKLTTITTDSTEGASFILVNATGVDILIDGESGNIKTGTDQQITLVNDGAVQFLYSNSMWRIVDGTVGQLSALQVEVSTVPNHGFVQADIGSPLYIDELGTYNKANAATINTAEVIGLLGGIIDSDTFELVTHGLVQNIPAAQIEGGTPSVGDVLFLSALTDGKLSLDEPGTVGHVSKPMGTVYSHDALNQTYTMFAYTMRGIAVGAVDVRTEIPIDTSFYGAQTIITDLTDYEAGQIKGWFSYTEVGTGITRSRYLYVTFLKTDLTGTDVFNGYRIYYNFFASDIGFASLIFEVNASSQLFVKFNSVNTSTAGRFNFTIEGPGLGASLQDLDSKNIHFTTVSPATTAPIVFTNSTQTTNNIQIEDSGRVRIGYSGTDTPGLSNEKLRVVGPILSEWAYNHGLLIEGNSAGGTISVPAGDKTLKLAGGSNSVNPANAITLYTAAVERARFDHQGRFLLGTDTVLSGYSSLAPKAVIYADYAPSIVIDTQYGPKSGLYFTQGTTTGSGAVTYDVTTKAMTLDTDNTERMRITSSGSLLVGTTIGVYAGDKVAIENTTNSTSVALGVKAQNRVMGFVLRSNGGTYQEFYCQGTGNTTGSVTTNGSTTSFNTSFSDYRLKQEIQYLNGGLEKIKQLRPVSFKWKKSGKEDFGFIAHEIASVIPECTTGEKDAVDAEGNPIYQSIFPAPAQMIASLVSAIQEQQAQIEELKAEIEKLKIR